MLIPFFYHLRHYQLPVSLTEFLALLDGLDRHLAGFSTDDFYYLARTTLIKDERFYDRFDRAFGTYFNGIEERFEAVFGTEIPDEWLRSQAELSLTDEEKRQIEALGGWERLMETLAERLAEQRERHRGGNKWIGTGGRSPFGADGYNPEGVRIGQSQSRHRRAVKVWDQRQYRNLDDSVELGTRNIKVALRKLRRFAREGAADRLDLASTIRSTARNGGMLQLDMVAERRNALKVLLFFDIGGSMDEHVKAVQELFAAARSEFKHLDYYYFHNCVYESVWKDNRRRHSERTALIDVLRTYGRDYRLIFVGDASMSPYELTQPGGSVEHFNDEAGVVWLRRLLDAFPHCVWLNPVPENYWSYTASIELVREVLESRMYPLTLNGLDRAIDALKRARANIEPAP